MGEMKKNLRVRVRGTIIRLNALFDSGAEYNFVNIRILEKLIFRNKLAKMMLRKTGGYELCLGPKEKFELGDGTVRMGYRTAVSVFWRNRYITTEAVVTEYIQEQLILGQPFLQNNNVILNFKNDTFELSKHAPKYHKIGRM